LRNSREFDLAVEEVADVVLESPRGIVCSLHLDFLQRPVQRNCSFLGEKGQLEWDVISNKVLHRKPGEVVVCEHDDSYDKNLMYIDLMRDFQSVVDGHESDTLARISDGVQTLEVIDNIQQLAMRG
jgi:hypothetical protein